MIKYFILLLMVSSVSNAKDFTFFYPYGSNFNKLEYSTSTKNETEAYEEAVNYCVDFYIKKISQNKVIIMNIIDACVNPR